MHYIYEKIKEYQTIIIHRHTRPDGDCMGSQLGLKDIIEQTFPDKDVYAVGEEIPQFYELGRMDEISDDLYKDALVFIVDVADKARVSDQRFLKGKELIKIDHHPKKEDICELEWIDTSFAACCEMIVEFYLQNKDKLKLSKKGATALYFGLVTDTLRFSTPATTSRTFNHACFLLEYDLDLPHLMEMIYDEPLKMTRLRGYVGSHFTCTPNGLGYIKIDEQMCKEYEVDSGISNVLVDTMSHTKEVEIWFVAIYDFKTNNVRISLRSKRLSINQFADQFGGGGHKLASGIIVKDFNRVDELIEAIEDYLKDYKG